MTSQSARKLVSSAIKKTGITEDNLVKKSGVAKRDYIGFLNGRDISIQQFAALINACGYQLAFSVQNGFEAV